MASPDYTMHITMICDTTELQEAILKLKTGLDVRTKCAVADCTKLNSEYNRIETALEAPGTPDVCFYVCDEHFNRMVYLNPSTRGVGN